jgi:hypothetical protein
MKADGAQKSKQIVGEFEWRRNRLLVQLGSSFFVDTPVILRVRGLDRIWLTRDERDEIGLNFIMPGPPGSPRAVMLDNTWIVPPDAAADVQCPPRGKTLRIDYPDGDRFEIAFSEIFSADAFRSRFPKDSIPWWASGDDLAEQLGQFPLTLAQVTSRSKGLFDFTPTATRLGGASFSDSLFQGNEVAMEVNPAPGRGGPVFEGDTLDIGHLASAEWPIVEGATFRNCVLRGPAMVAFVASSADGNDLIGDNIQIPRMPAGTVRFLGCVIEGCELLQITLISSPPATTQPEGA